MLGSEITNPLANMPVPNATDNSEENTNKLCEPKSPRLNAEPSRPNTDVISLLKNRPDIDDEELEPVEESLVQDADVLITESMLEEEEKLEKESTKKEQKESLKQLKDQALTDFNSHVEKQRFQRLHFLLEKSTHYSSFLAAKMKKQQEEFRLAAEKKAAVASAASVDEEPITTDGVQDDAEAGSAKRRSARGGTTKASDDATNAKIAAANARKRKKEVSTKPYNLADYIDSEEINKRQKKEDEQDMPAEVESEQLVEPTVPSEPPHAESKNTDGPVVSARQPKLITGGVLREYQLQGVEWMISLYENGLNGILADEMGLGKTLQTISFLAHLRDRSVWGPFLIVAPLSTLSNWVSEVQRFAPTIPVVLYHGSKDERMHIRNAKMKHLNDKFPIVVTSYEVVMNDRKHLAVYSWKYIVVDEGHRLKNLNCKLIRELKSYTSANRLLLSGTPLQNNLSELWSLMNFLLPDIFDDLEAFQSWFDFSDLGMADGAKRILGEERTNSVVSNLHQILQPFLLRRLKTDVEVDLPKKREYLLFAPLAAKQKEIYDAVLSRDIRAFLVKQRNGSGSDQTSSPGGTPNAGDDDNSSIGTPDSVNGDGQSDTRDSSGTLESANNGVPTDGTAVLDSEKTELNGGEGADVDIGNDADTVLPESEEVNGEILAGDGRATIDADAGIQTPVTDENQGSDPVSPAAGKRKKKKEVPMSERRRSNRFQNDGRVLEESRKTYKQESDRDYFSRIEDENFEPAPPLAPEVRKLGEWRNKQNTKNVNNMKLQNMIMQLRKVCNHPYLFDENYPFDSNLVTHSGKMRLLDRLLPALFERGHRVLIFSQMTLMLDIIQGWCNEVKGWPVFRIDGSVPQPERRRQMDEFNDPNSKVNLFLLSTRSGGLGINLTSADTVIIFDSDWNPQMDLQAQDRVHRIGQTKPVVIYRLVTANTVESQILKKANTKRKLEKIVIHKGRFIGDKISSGDSKKGSVVKGYLAAELAELLAVEDGEKVAADDGGEVISDENLERLLDRSPAAYDVQAKPFDVDREDGQGDAPGMFRVVEGIRDETTDALATRM